MFQHDEPCRVFLLQKLLLLLTAFGQIDEEKYDGEAHDAEGRQEVKGGRVVVRRGGVNDGARDVGPNE